MVADHTSAAHTVPACLNANACMMGAPDPGFLVGGQLRMQTVNFVVMTLQLEAVCLSWAPLMLQNHL
jgi:hypothetical protein